MRAACRRLAAGKFSVAIRSGALIDATADVRGRWHLSPIEGDDLARELRRLADPQTGGIAGNEVSDAMMAELADARAAEARVLRLDSDPRAADRKVAAAPLWRRAEPDNDPALADVARRRYCRLDRQMRRVITFPCAGDTLVGTIDEALGTTGLLIVSGGNEIRSGAHRGMALLAADIATLGYPVFRYDRRGVGDSSGENGGFLSSSDDLAMAVTAFRGEAPHLSRIVGFGNCDAASTLALFGRAAGIDAVLLANPWVVEADRRFASRRCDPCALRGAAPRSVVADPKRCRFTQGVEGVAEDCCVPIGPTVGAAGDRGHRGMAGGRYHSARQR